MLLDRSLIHFFQTLSHSSAVRGAASGLPDPGPEEEGGAAKSGRQPGYEVERRHLKGSSPEELSDRRGSSRGYHELPAGGGVVFDWSCVVEDVMPK